MKLLLLLTLSIFAFAINPSNVTDIQDLKTNADDILFLQSSNFECNLYIENAGQYILLMNKAEKAHNLSAIANNYVLFLDQSNKAIAICRDINPAVANDIIDIQSNIEIYYKLTYKQAIMQPILISINKQQVQIGYQLPDVITQLSLDLNTLIQLQCEQHEVALIKAWLNDVVDRLDTEYVSYNGTLVKSTDLRKF